MIFIPVIATSLFLFGCRSSKVISPSATTSGSSLGVEIQKSPAQLYAEDKSATTLRAWGFYNGFADDNLESVAAANARAELSNQIAVLSSQALTNFTDRCDKQGMAGGEMAKKKIKDTKVTDEIKSVSENLISGSKIAVSNRYGQSDGTQTVYVCVEIDPNVIANKIKNDAAIINAITDDEQMKIAFKEQMFNESMKESFEQFRAKASGK